VVRNVSHSDQIARVRNDNVIGEAPVDVESEGGRPRTQVLGAAETDRARTAANPGEDEPPISLLYACGIGSGGENLAHDLVPERPRELHASREFEDLTASQVEVAVLYVEVAMADPAGRHAQEYLRASWLRGGPDLLPERSTEVE